MHGHRRLPEKIIKNLWFKENLINKNKTHQSHQLKYEIILITTKRTLNSHLNLIDEKEVKIFESYLKFLKILIFTDSQILKWYSSSDPLIEQVDKNHKMFINIKLNQDLMLKIHIINEITPLEKAKNFKNQKLKYSINPINIIMMDIIHKVKC